MTGSPFSTTSALGDHSTPSNYRCLVVECDQEKGGRVQWAGLQVVAGWTVPWDTLCCLVVDGGWSPWTGQKEAERRW